ncbi:MAG: dihydroorotase [Candidatus Muproteobacteria bacterium RIFCSPHIGHO2_01_FULL_65_16]|uniref:Dihydroorotase n=2 Tax=Candidatus Muproteobacteria TaxID=1817795 RepID=A0A1F6TLW6_9PROT|nr:MAG: dihydroorotase [Candidatus Muproteobacteria bacterium RIFCSPHIGHO2_01_FULL_65_16]OGI48477.1 MAG: dihydroorotase [Candidatus Muproteobacteria bacterium RIFCSPHIGHO2_02_FULL_65_16]
MTSLLIRNASIARPDGSTFEGDLLCADGRIARIARRLGAEADETIDAAGKLLLPGVIDAQVHFREPGREYKEDLASGARAAVKGGVTGFLDMPNTDPPTVSQAALDDKLGRAAEKCVANYGFFIGATPDNLDEINRAAPACGIKVFMGASTGSLLVDRPEDLERIFANGTRLIAVHAEDEARIRARAGEFAGRTDPATHSLVRDNESARLATARALALAQKYRRRLHVLHLSTREEVELLRRDKPAWVTAEATPNHLFLDVRDYASKGTLVQMNPPLRAPEDSAALWRGLRDGTIDFIATDHAPHTLEEKHRGYPQAPSGMPGVETSLPLMLTAYKDGRCTLAEIQKWMCWGPAQAYRIPNKGKIVEGWDADLTLVDMDSTRPVRDEDMLTKVRWSPFSGRELVGWPIYTIVGGAIAYDKGRIREGVRGKALQFQI